MKKSTLDPTGYLDSLVKKVQEAPEVFRTTEALEYLEAAFEYGRRSIAPHVDYPRDDAVKLAKAVLAAHGALNIDMGDGEPTYQCCNTVCGHGGGCLVGVTLQIARKLTRLLPADLAYMNASRARGGLQPPIVDDVPCDCDDGTDPDEPADRGFVCEHSPDAHVTEV